MVDISSGDNKINITVSTSGNKASVNATSDTAMYYSNKSREWAISDKIVDNEDYSSKYYANISKQNADKSIATFENLTTNYNQYKNELENTKNISVEEIEMAKTNAISDITNQETLSVDNVNIAGETQVNLAKEQATIATTQAGIATAKTNEVIESGNSAITAITEQETTSKNNIETKGAEQIELIQNEGATQIANVQSTGFYMRDDKLYFINSQGEETEFKSGGSGLEVCDIGISLYVDETKGLRRYLNGQIVDININTQAFLDRLKQITALHPSLLCTEAEWQTAKKMSAFGQVGKFVFNYADDGVTVVSVRIPRVVNIQGVFDLQNLGLTVDAGLPTHTHTRGTMEISGTFPAGRDGFGTSGAFSQTSRVDTYGGGKYDLGMFDFYASRSWTGSTSAPDNSVYGASNTVQQEAIQYPYFIQIATGSETENNIINDIELNNPYSLFDSKYSDHELNNLSWLKSEGQWNAKAVYPTAYDKLLKIYNGAETVEGLSVKLWTDESATDYDFRINTADETFRLPLLNGSEDLLSDRYNDLTLQSSGSTYTAPANGWFYFTKEATAGGQYATFENASDGASGESCAYTAHAAGYRCVLLRPVKKGTTIQLRYNIAGTTQYFRFIYAQGNGTLYYYVGETVQNAHLIDAGRIGEQLANKQDKCIHIIDTYVNGTSGYNICSNGYCEQWGFVNSSGNVVYLKTFKNNDYNLVFGLYSNFSSAISAYNLGCYSKSQTGFSHYTDGNCAKYWKASGYLAEGQY